MPSNDCNLPMTPLPLVDGFDSCTRCGLCLGVCPTYQTFRRETVSPRGRLAIMRLEDHSEIASSYIRSCFRCALCETVCPTSVPYGQLVRQYLQQAPIATVEFASVRDRAIEGYSDRGTNLYLPEVERAAMTIREAEDGAVLILAGPAMPLYFPDVMSQATRLLEALGFPRAVVDSNKWGVGLLEHGFREDYDRSVHEFAEAATGYRQIFVLDPWIDALLQRHRVARWCPELPLTQSLLATAFGRPVEVAFPGAHVLDVTPATVSLSKTLEEILFRERALDSVLPDVLVAGGALPIADSVALPLMLAYAKRKSQWLAERVNPIITTDPLTLMRNPRAQHAFTYMQF